MNLLNAIVDRLNRSNRISIHTLGSYGHMGCSESWRNGADLNLTGFAIRLYDGETPSVESFSTIRFVIFVTRRISIVCCKQRSCPLDLESNFIIRGGHNPALLVQDMDCDVSHIARICRD